MRSILNKTCLLTLICILFCRFSYAQEERTQVLPYKYDEVWRGLLIALAKYPLKKNNQADGYIETEVLSGAQIWSPPHKKVNPKLRYKLSFKIFDIKSSKKRTTKISVTKKGYLKNEFIGDNKTVVSDNLEEMALIYRTSREIKINRLADQKFNSKKTKRRRRK